MDGKRTQTNTIILNLWRITFLKKEQRKPGRKGKKPRACRVRIQLFIAPDWSSSTFFDVLHFSFEFFPPVPLSFPLRMQTAMGGSNKGGDVAAESKSASSTTATTTRSEEWGANFPWVVRFGTGVLLTVNFVMFWAVPIFGQGQIWKLFLSKLGTPIYNYLERHPKIREIGQRFYRKPQHAGFWMLAATVFFDHAFPLQICFYFFALSSSSAFVTDWCTIFF